MKVAYQGLRGAYSEAALRKHFGPKAKTLPLELSEDVFAAVETGRADYGILPVENTIAGPVAVNADLFWEKSVFATAECYLRIEHCLLAPPHSKLEWLKTVYSHPVALAQCRAFIRGRKLTAVPEYDTAGAAKLVAERNVVSEAAIASADCAKAYGLKVLKRGVQSYRNNITRFLVFTRPALVPKGVRMQKTSVVFSTRHKPGELLHCLQHFADHGINLTRLESRPIPENPFEYVFFVDFLGGLKDKRVASALRKIGADAHVLKVLGSYPLGRR
ncbi:MAG: prephenate dehydratase [Elusimicrobia bacterium]|nr:prephenate dehydratase [Elusimicrobiota bacterium]